MRKFGSSSHLIVVFSGIRMVFKPIKVQWLDCSKKLFLLYTIRIVYRPRGLEGPFTEITSDVLDRKPEATVDQICTAAGIVKSTPS